MTLAYLGVGANLGERAANLWEAARQVNAIPCCQLVRFSPIYETEPVGVVDQPWFLNAVLAVETQLDPAGLLAALKAVEQSMGRTPGPRWGPRNIDLDILLHGDARIDSEDLTVPHHELWNRRFVLLPLADILEAGTLADRVARRLRELPPTPLVRPYRL